MPSKDKPPGDQSHATETTVIETAPANLAFDEIEALVKEAKAGGARALNKLIAYCEQLIQAQVSAVHPRPYSLTDDDLAQVGREAIWKALSSYETGRGAWLGYARIAVRRAVFRAKEQALKREQRYQSGEGATLAYEHHIDDDACTPLDQLIAYDEAGQLNREIADELAAMASLPSWREIERRIELGRALRPTDPIAERDLRPLNRDRLALLTLLLLSRHSTLGGSPPSCSQRRRRRPRSFFWDTKTRQGAGAPKSRQLSLFDLLSGT